MVLYHGSANAGFARFWETGGRQRGDLGIFLTDNKSMARSYVRRGRAVDVTRQMVDDVQDYIIDNSGGVYGLFVNIRSASEEDFKGANWDGQMTGMDLFEVYDADGDVAYTADGRDVMSRDEAEALADEIGGTFEEASSLGFSTDDVVRQARDDGVDGAIMYKVMDDGGGPGYNYEPSTVVAVFDPRNVKSADFNEGSFDDSADIRFSESPWYSALARAIEKGPAQAPAEQWRAFLKGLPGKGVKQDEIEWSGVEEWLKLQTGKVQRQAVLDYLNANGVTMFSEMGRRDVTQTPEFKRWFGDSKVVDADGKPLVAYHGTNVDFEAFETSGANELGSWFTAPAKRYGDAAAVDDARAAAEDFAATQVDLYGGADIVVPVYLSIKSPKVFRGYGAFERWSDNSADGRALRERLIAEGHDGVVIRNSRTDGGALRDDWVAFEPEQIKSAIGNDGSFDIDDTDIRSSEYGKEKDRFGRKFLPGQRQPKRPRASDLKVGSVKSDVTVNVLTRAIDDEYPIVNAARKAGSAVADAWKIAVEALPGRTADAINQAHKQLIDPMVKAMGEAAKSLKMDSAQLIDAYGIYRLAKHAPERNKTLRANGSKKANPAGMSEAEASQWMTFFRGEPDLLRALESFDPMLKAIQDRTDSVKLAAGLITQEEIDSRSDWDWYVSLRGDPGADETGGVKGGGGWNNDIDPRARGRDSLSANPVINTVKMLENAIRLAEMARVKKATYEMAEAHPDILQAKVTRVFNRPFFDEDGNFARAFPNTDKFSTDSVVYRNGDVEYKIEIGDGKVINAIKKLENRQLDPVIRGFGKLVSVLGRLFTQFSPHFPLVNFIRDLQQQIAYIAGQDIDIGGRKISSAKAAFMIMSRYPKTFAAAVSEVMGRTPTGKYTRLARELHEQGGMSGFSKMFSDEEALADFTKRVQWKAGKAMSSLAWNKFVDFVGDVSEVFEMTTRVAAYSVMRDMGMDAAAGANFTKNLMNFSKAGTSVRGFLGNFYMFLKPSIQDVYLTSKLLRTKKGAIVLGSMYAGAVALYAMLRELSGDDDEDPRLKRMDTRNASERRAYYILPYWGKDGDKPLRIPVGFGLPRIAWGLAVTTVDGALNPDFDQAAVADGVVKSLTSTLSPMQLSENNMFTNTPEFLATTFAPTLALPVIELAMNKSKAGNTISRGGNYQQLPDYAQSFSSTPKEFKDAAEWMYDTTNGKIDVAPETLQHVMRSYGGGPAGVMLNALQSGERQRQGQEITRRDVPIVQAFTGAPDRYPEKRFRDMSKEVDELTRKIKDSEIRGTPLAQRLRDENEILLAIKSDIDRIERMESKAIADIRQLYRQDYNAAARETRALEIEMRAEKQALLDAYNEMKRSSK